MRFHLVDQILEVHAGKQIRAVKNLALGEEYLADHFPTFPVMPGVLMLQTLVEAASWLWRVTDDFAFSMITLREVRGVKYGSFMEPGKQMLISVDVTEMEGDRASFRGKGEAEGNSTVSARFSLARYNLREKNPDLARVDERLVSHWRERFLLLRSLPVPVLLAAGSAAGDDA